MSVDRVIGVAEAIADRFKRYEAEHGRAYAWDDAVRDNVGGWQHAYLDRSMTGGTSAVTPFSHPPLSEDDLKRAFQMAQEQIGKNAPA